MAALLALVAAAALAIMLIRVRSLKRQLADRTREADELRQRVAAAEQLAHVGRRLSELAQELKAPLQGVIGNAEVMMAGEPAHGEELRDIHTSAARAAGIVRNLLTFTAAVPIARRWQDINDVLARAVETSRVESSGLRVAVARADRLPLVYVDGRQIEKVLATLLSRPLPIRPGVPDVPAVTLGVLSQGASEERLVIDIDDRAAEPLPPGAVWPMSLEVCRHVVEAHGGTLHLLQPSDGGCRFHLELPLTAPALNGSDTDG